MVGVVSRRSRVVRRVDIVVLGLSVSSLRLHCRHRLAVALPHGAFVPSRLVPRALEVSEYHE